METIIERTTVSMCVFAIVSAPSFVSGARDPGSRPPSNLQSPRRCERAVVQQLLRAMGELPPKLRAERQAITRVQPSGLPL